MHIGASDGRHTVVMSRLIGDGEIHCFEPSSYTLKILRRVLNIHRIRNVKTHNVAMGDQAGNTYLITPVKRNGHIGRSFAFLSDKIPDIDSLKQTRGFRNIIVDTVPVCTVDSFCKKQQIETIQFIRCDVEGAEMLVLKGAGEVIKKNRPLMLLEVHPFSLRDHFSSSAEDLYRILASWRYRMFFVDGNSLVEANHFFKEPWRDYFCVPEEKVQQIMTNKS
ncbi:MAG: FkbM family methyltransferase [Gammaproteobacteria bacterium]|nr:FkbM family methyltransferase [Gammaproteobacteria bacterium]